MPLHVFPSQTLYSVCTIPVISIWPHIPCMAHWPWKWQPHISQQKTNIFFNLNAWYIFSSLFCTSVISKDCLCSRHQCIWGRRGMAPLTLKLGTSWRWVVNSIPSHFTPMKLPLPTEEEAEYVPGPGWMYCRQEISFAPTQNWTPDCLAHRPVTLLTIQAQLLKIYYNFARHNNLHSLKQGFKECISVFY